MLTSTESIQKDNGVIPYFTIKELSCLYKNFALFIEDNSESLIETGWPEYNFPDSAWLFYKLAPNYPIEIPIYINSFSKLKNPSSDPYFFLNKYFLNELNIFSNLLRIHLLINKKKLLLYRLYKSNS